MIIDESMEAITAQVDFQQLTASVFDGIARSRPAAAAPMQRCGLLQAPAANGLENLVDQTVTRVVESDAFSDVWATATRAAHRALDGRRDLRRRRAGRPHRRGCRHPARRRGRARQAEPHRSRISASPQLIPTIDQVVIIGEGDNLTAIRTGYAIAATLGFWLPVITLALCSARHPARPAPQHGRPRHRHRA
jgi:hypothetical protein